MRHPVLRLLAVAIAFSQSILVVAQTPPPLSEHAIKGPIYFETLRSLGARGGENQFPTPGGGGTGTGGTGTGGTGGGSGKGTGRIGIGVLGTGATGALSDLPNRGGIAIQPGMQPNNMRSFGAGGSSAP